MGGEEGGGKGGVDEGGGEVEHVSDLMGGSRGVEPKVDSINHFAEHQLRIDFYVNLRSEGKHMIILITHREVFSSGL